MTKNELTLSWSLHNPEFKSQERFDFEKYIHIYLGFINTFSMTPTYIGLSGKGYSNNKIISFEKGQKELNDNHFKDLTSASIYISRPDSTDYAFYWETMFHASCSNILGAHCFLGISIKNARMIKELFTLVIEPICGVFKPLLGYAYVTTPEAGPFAYSQGAVHTAKPDYLTADQEELIFIWSRDEDLVVSGKLRDLYQFNILSEFHLNRNIDGSTLENWIASNPGERGVLTTLSKNNKLWTVIAPNYIKIRDKLFESDMLIAYDKNHIPTIFI